METYFASPERSSAEQLHAEIAFVTNNAIVTGILHSVSGLLAVLNSNRQILALNDSLIRMLGIDEPAKVLGLRPGEALQCVHSHEMPGGCGTSESCSNCGAVTSMLSSHTECQPTEAECSITAEDSGKKQDMYFRVRCVPMVYNDSRFQLLFMQDITYQKRLAALERVFFHDISGIISSLLTTSNLMVLGPVEDIGATSETVYKLARHLANEVSIQRCLFQTGADGYQPVISSITPVQLFEEVKRFFINNPVSHGKVLTIANELHDVEVKTDRSLCLRVLCNMITNAFEATEEGEEVKAWAELVTGRLFFCVWNKKAIPITVQKRIFERNFSTKSGIGRGLGTYSMKLFGEEILGGTVCYTTSENEGSVFRFGLPV